MQNAHWKVFFTLFQCIFNRVWPLGQYHVHYSHERLRWNISPCLSPLLRRQFRYFWHTPSGCARTSSSRGTQCPVLYYVSLVSPCGLIATTYAPSFTLNGGENLGFTKFWCFTARWAEWSTACAGSTWAPAHWCGCKTTNSHSLTRATVKKK